MLRLKLEERVRFEPENDGAGRHRAPQTDGAFATLVRSDGFLKSALKPVALEYQRYRVATLKVQTESI
jgi:hypothetical protein